MGRNPDVYPDPLTVKPERWIPFEVVVVVTVVVLMMVMMMMVMMVVVMMVVMMMMVVVVVVVVHGSEPGRLPRPPHYETRAMDTF